MSLLVRYEGRLRSWGWEMRESSALQISIASACDGPVMSLESAPAVEAVELGVPAMLEYTRALDATGGGSTLPPPAVLRVLASKACRSAVMFGDVLSLHRCQTVLESLARCDLPFQCAHGRPTLTPVLDLGTLQEPPQ